METVEMLTKLNKEMAWDIYEKDKMIEFLRIQVSYLKEILIHEGIIDEKKYN
jgi:hypothetical protein